MAYSRIPFATLLILSSAFGLICLAEASNILYSGETLRTGQSLSHGSFVLTMQANCNLVLYKGGTTIWASNTEGLDKNCHCDLKKDGNLVVYNPGNRKIWSTRSSRSKANYALVMQKDGNVVIYGPAVWATGTFTK